MVAPSEAVTTISAVVSPPAATFCAVAAVPLVMAAAVPPSKAMVALAPLCAKVAVNATLVESRPICAVYSSVSASKTGAKTSATESLPSAASADKVASASSPVVTVCDDDQALSPLMFSARTWMSYSVPSVSPVMV